MKSKVYSVDIDGQKHLVEARTKAGAARDVSKELVKTIMERATVDMATGEQLYEAGRSGGVILNSEHYKRGADPNQLPLTGVPETAAPSCG